MQTLTTVPLLTALPSGDALELRPAGSWTAANATALEALTNSLEDATLTVANALRIAKIELREIAVHADDTYLADECAPAVQWRAWFATRDLLRAFRATR